MDILIVAHFCRDFSESDSGRFLYLANMLSERHDVEIVTSDFYHREKRHRAKPAVERDFKITFLHEPGYRKNIGLGRIYGHRCFGREVRKYLQSRKQPDVIYCAVPSLSAPKAVAEYCAEHKVRMIADIQDLWPEGLTFGLMKYPLLNRIKLNGMKKKADYIYATADAVAAVSETYVKRALSVNRKCAEGKTVYIGTTLSVFDGYASAPCVFTKAENEKWLGFAGTLGANQDIPCVLRALKRMKNPPKLIVMGSGPMLNEFKAMADAEHVDAVFTGLFPYAKMCAVLKQCDLVVNPIVKGSPMSILNKHGDYAAVGLPVINTQQSPEYRDLVDTYQMGWNCPCGDDKAVAEAIERLLGDAELCATMGKNARRCAEERFDRKTSYLALAELIENG